MFRLRYLAAALAVALVGWLPVRADQRMSYEEAKRLIEQIEKSSDAFKDSFKDSMHGSGLDSRTRDEMSHFVKDFDHATERLKDRYNKKDAAVSAAEDVLQK